MSGSLPKPTASELQILTVLWRIGPATVRAVHSELDPDGSTGYTTVLKLMQIMSEKGLLSRDDRERAHVYRPAVAREQTQGQMVVDMLDRVFGGSASQLVLRALSEKPATAEELQKIRKMLDDLEERA